MVTSCASIALLQRCEIQEYALENRQIALEDRRNMRLKTAEKALEYALEDRRKRRFKTAGICA